MIDLAQLPIFPCNLAKEPLSVHGFKSARRGAKWKHWPLVGFPTGAASGIDILDIDPRGRDWYEQNFDALPQTRAHETQRGLHLLFSHTPGLRCSTSKIAEGVDVRADGGYAIWWPATGRQIEDHPICEMPEWLLREAGLGLDTWYPKTGIIIPTTHHPPDPALAADCTAALWEMNAEDWRGKHAQWLELLIGAKHVGISLAEFTAWCITDAQYADDADSIQRQWHSVVTAHGGAFWRELSKRRIRLGQGDNERFGVPNALPKSKLSAHQPSRNPDARLNHISAEISENPTERALFSWSCLAAEIVHECKRKPSQIMRLLEGATMSTPLWETLGREGVRRTIGNAFRPLLLVISLLLLLVIDAG
jgi:hypothetical protein